MSPGGSGREPAGPSQAPTPSASREGSPMTEPGAVLVGAILGIPAVSAVLLAILPDDRTTARLNVLAAALTLAAAIGLLVERPAPGAFLIVDDLNIVFIVLSTFIGFTTSVFSGTYIAHELEV